jgi:hypothetical protein
MSGDWLTRLTERQRIGVMLLEPLLQSELLDRYPPEVHQVTECRWAAEAIAAAWPYATPTLVGEQLQRTVEGDKTRGDFVGGKWLIQSARMVPEWCDVLILAAGQGKDVSRETSRH